MYTLKLYFICSCVHINGLCEMGVSNVELWNVVLAAKQNLLKELVSGDIIFCLNVSQISTFVCALTFNHGQINYKDTKPLNVVFTGV